MLFIVEEFKLLLFEASKYIPTENESSVSSTMKDLF